MCIIFSFFFCFNRVQEESRPAKLLRLVKKPVEPAIELNLQSATSSQECLQILLKLEESLPIDGENISAVLRELLDHFSREKEAMVRCKIANIVRELARIPGFNHDLYTNEILALLKTESNCFFYWVLFYWVVSLQDVANQGFPQYPILCIS